ncbi:MAG: GNAT family acetyltransferase [Desulfofustis sp.]|nr:GNAT family acetyltransferase [Desulfofustis sp.]NNK12656.1 GNAT family acetyltransferase [Desulfofustis sp.]RZW26507.1 MAG: GNAT family acetyltransferase [Desulfobulbaceae bacterium]
MIIRPFAEKDRHPVIRLWQRCGLVVPWNDPSVDIDRKLQADPELFVVGLIDKELVACAMGGYDGHRGSIFYLAVDPDLQGQGCGRRIVEHLATLLTQRGCPKINILVRSTNQGVIEFYRRLGFNYEEILCLGKRLIED